MSGDQVTLLSILGVIGVTEFTILPKDWNRAAGARPETPAVSPPSAAMCEEQNRGVCSRQAEVRLLAKPRKPA